MSSVYYVQQFSQFAKDQLIKWEGRFNGAGYIPFTVHKFSGGTRFVGGFLEAVISVALAILINIVSGDDVKLQKEGWKLLDFTVHGLGNMFRGFVECHAWIHLICYLYDEFVPENARLSYSRSIFKG